SEHHYDDAGNVVRIIDALGGVSEYEVEDGQVVTFRDPVGNVTTYVHDRDGVRTHEVTPLGEVRPWPTAPGEAKDAYHSLPDPLAWEWGTSPSVPERLPFPSEVPYTIQTANVGVATAST